MKKTAIALCCACSLFFVSCASKPDSQTPVQEFEAPETTDDEETSEVEETSSDFETEIENQTDDEENDAEEQSEEIIDYSDTDELEDIEEPVVITLEPEEESEENDETENPENEEILPSEPIEVETPPDITSDTEDTSEVEEDDTEESIEVNDDENIEDDDVISVIDDDSDSDVIEITDDEDEISEEEALDQEEIIPSRKVTVKKQEYIDITYPGNGWIYMGLTDGSKDISYFGRKLGTSNTKFTLQAKNAGIKIVHFYKNDALTNQYIDDYIEIEVLAEKGSNKTHIEAPEYKQPSPKKIKTREPENEAAEKTETSEKEAAISNVQQENQTGSSNSIPVKSKQINEEPVAAVEPTYESSFEEKSVPDTNILLKEAQVLYNEKEYKAALSKLNDFFEYSTSKRDEALYLKGQILEAKSEVQDIKASLEAYTTLTKNYPASKFWDNANKRIIYLKRFYFGG